MIGAKIAFQAVAVIAFAAVFVFAAVLLDDYSRSHWVPSAVAVRTALFSGVTFFAVILHFRRDWSRASFWLIMLAVLLTHIISFTLLLQQLPDPPLPVFAAVSLLEIPLLCALVDRAGVRF